MQLITILESDESAKTAHVQTNDDTLIGTGAAGGNARLQFAVPNDDEGKTQPSGTLLWAGTVKASVAAAYPGAELHTVDTLNAKVQSIYVSKGLGVILKSGAYVSKDEKARLDGIAATAKAAADAAAAKVAAAVAALTAAQAAATSASAAVQADPAAVALVATADVAVGVEEGRGVQVVEAAVDPAVALVQEADAAATEAQRAADALTQAETDSANAAAAASAALAAAT